MDWNLENELEIDGHMQHNINRYGLRAAVLLFSGSAGAI